MPRPPTEHTHPRCSRVADSCANAGTRSAMPWVMASSRCNRCSSQLVSTVTAKQRAMASKLRGLKNAGAGMHQPAPSAATAGSKPSCTNVVKFEIGTPATPDRAAADHQLQGQPAQNSSRRTFTQRSLQQPGCHQPGSGLIADDHSGRQRRPRSPQRGPSMPPGDPQPRQTARGAGPATPRPPTAGHTGEHKRQPEKAQMDC